MNYIKFTLKNGTIILIDKNEIANKENIELGRVDYSVRMYINTIRSYLYIGDLDDDTQVVEINKDNSGYVPGR